MLLHRAIPAMGKSVLPYEQAYNDLTTAVARAKKACRKRRKKSQEEFKTAKYICETADDKNRRGRPKGSKDIVPRKKRSIVRSLNVHPGRSSIPVACSDTDLILRFGVAPYETEAGAPPEITIFDMHGVSKSQMDLNQDPPCWELPLPY